MGVGKLQVILHIPGTRGWERMSFCFLPELWLKHGILLFLTPGMRNFPFRLWERARFVLGITVRAFRYYLKRTSFRPSYRLFALLTRRKKEGGRTPSPIGYVVLEHVCNHCNPFCVLFPGPPRAREMRLWPLHPRYQAVEQVVWAGTWRHHTFHRP